MNDNDNQLRYMTAEDEISKGESSENDEQPKPKMATKAQQLVKVILDKPYKKGTSNSEEKTERTRHFHLFYENER